MHCSFERRAREVFAAPENKDSIITTRQQRRPTPRHVKKAMRQLWRNDVKRWCESTDREVDWGRGEREEQMLAEWPSATPDAMHR